MKKKKCKEANFNFVLFAFILFFCLFSIFFTSLDLVRLKDNFLFGRDILSILIYWILIYVFVIRLLIRNILVRRKGIIVHAIVKGYRDDSWSINGKPCQIIRLSFKNGNTKKTIYYKLKGTKRPYEINSEIELYTYKNIYLIKDKKKNKSQKIVIITIFILLITIVSYLTVSLYIPYLLNKTPHQRELYFIEQRNKEIRIEFKDLEYKIPDEYSLSLYDKDMEYKFETKNNNHHCVIDLYSSKSNQKILPVGECQFYNGNNSYQEYEEVQLNNKTWCYKKENKNDSIEEKYMINDGKNYYVVTLSSYKDNDEMCYVTFNEFKKTIKLK